MKYYYNYLILFVFIAGTTTGYSQMFQDLNAGLAPAGRSSSNWVDFDGDGDLDLLVTGISTNDTRISKIYRNDEGSFVDINAGLIGLKESCSDWGDYDGDGDLDLVIAGNSDDGDKTILYRNDDGIFTDIGAGLPMVSIGDVSWADYDLDGDLDIFLTGNWLGKIFRNDNGIFNESGQEFGYWASSSVAWGDFDNDGDLDILINGDSGAGAKSSVFINTEGTFSEATDIVLPGLMAGTVHWIDYDNDGDLDISITGFDDALEAHFNIYENLGDGTFEQFFAGIEGVALSGVDWGDYDNDGDLDIIMSGNGTGCGVIVSGIYRNDGPFFVKQGTSFTTGLRCDLQWADYDNDGDLDFIISGLTYSDAPFSKIYRNTEGMNLFQANSAPEHPDALSVETDGNTAVFTWSKGSDIETPADALSYNLMVGRSPEADDILSCMSHTPSGDRKVIRLGNMNQDTAWCVKGLDPGVYYYSVQSVDQGFRGSQFHPVQSFEIIATGTGDDPSQILTPEVYPNPARDHINLVMPGNETTLVEIFDLHGRLWISTMVSGHKRLNIAELPAGSYILNFSGNDLKGWSTRFVIR